MASGYFTKQVPRFSAKLNNNTGDAIVGGQITAAPSGLNISAGQSSIPGDRVILSAVDALAWSDTSVNTLYGGLYIYVRTKSNSVLTPTRGHLAFWDETVNGALAQVTPDESGLQGVGLIAGVFVSTLTKGYSWWIQAAGKTNTVFANPLTGFPSDGSPVYAAADAAGDADVLDGGGNPTFTQVGQMISRYLGIAIGAPVAGATSLVDQQLGGIFRW